MIPWSLGINPALKAQADSGFAPGPPLADTGGVGNGHPQTVVIVLPLCGVSGLGDDIAALQVSNLKGLLVGHKPAVIHIRQDD